MITYQIDAVVARRLTNWYCLNHRPFPWRDTGDPYDVWVSEIMLQQTRIEVVRQRFPLFKQQLPDIASLAAVSNERLMKLWEGMGYYSRARNMQRAANMILEQYGGEMPSDVSRLQTLPGIGAYTAGAIASIAFDQPVPAVDGNVLRVFSRLFTLDQDNRDPGMKKEVSAAIQQFYDDPEHKQLLNQKGFAGWFSQGWMELGEVACTPKGVRCDQCPLREYCRAQQTDTVSQYPRMSARKPRVQMDITALVVVDDDGFYLHKRPETGLLAELCEFPTREGYYSKQQVCQWMDQRGMEYRDCIALDEYQHSFTHRQWNMHGYKIILCAHCGVPADWIYVRYEDARRYALPSAFRPYRYCAQKQTG